MAPRERQSESDHHRKLTYVSLIFYSTQNAEWERMAPSERGGPPRRLGSKLIFCADMASNRPPLTPLERDALTDRTALADWTREQGPLLLENRSVEAIQIGDQVFDGVILRDVDFTDTAFNGTQFRNARLENVTMDEVTMTAVVFETCALVNAAWEATQLTQSRLAHCTIQVWSADACTWEETAVEDSRLDGFTDTRGLFRDTTFARVQMTSPCLQRSVFSRTRIDQLTIAGGKLQSVTMSDGSARGMLVRDAEVDGLEILLGEYQGLTFQGIRGGSLRIVSASCRGLGLIGCGELVGVTFSGADITGLVIDGCHALALLNIAGGELQSPLIVKSQIAGGSVRGCRIPSGGMADDSVFDGLDLEGSQFDGFAFHRSTFATVLRIAAASFRGLVLDGVTYASPLEIEADGVTYQGGQQFPSTGA